MLVNMSKWKSYYISNENSWKTNNIEKFPKSGKRHKDKLPVPSHLIIKSQE